MPTPTRVMTDRPRRPRGRPGAAWHRGRAGRRPTIRSVHMSAVDTSRRRRLTSLGWPLGVKCRGRDRLPSGGRPATAVAAATRVEEKMSGARRVPETRLLGEGELSADHAWRALRRYGGWPLVRDALVRFRSGDGFSHARALGLQLCLAAVPFLIALNGLASKLGLDRGGRVVADTVLALTPGASESLVGQLLADDEHARDIGEVALSLGLLTAVVALTTAVGQMERGANRIYGVERDRPALQKYARGLVLTVLAGLPALASFL